ncbi:hypothetical protein F4808DRAFT_461293 [Astrocystis sublimbata]|nr:hypothetical protein F4808DRAFT_461293 [Astrocystis sublimbata]
MEVSKWQRKQTIDALLSGYSSLSVDKLLEPLDPEFHHQTLPESLGMPIRNRDAFVKHAAGIFGVFEKFQMIPKAIIDDSSTGMVVVEAQMLGTLKGGKGEWTNECVMIVKLSEDGLKVLEVKEFVDSAKALEMARTHAPEDFKCDASDSSKAEKWKILGEFDSDSWIHVGAAVIVLVSLHRMVF